MLSFLVPVPTYYSRLTSNNKDLLYDTGKQYILGGKQWHKWACSLSVHSLHHPACLYRQTVHSSSTAA